FGPLRRDLHALYAAYYVAELLCDWTEDHDAHPALFDEALRALATLGQPEVLAGPRLARFELVLLRELGYGPALDACAGCTQALAQDRLAFSAAAGGMLCPACQNRHRDRRMLSPAAWHALQALREPDEAWRTVREVGVRAEVRQA